ncbi:hypothetical protein SUGI_0895110 [Cryptomeria japonica]|nr:hypothetical protein SUGI_0895110 [Cryptomeria japonica]
MYKYNSVLNNTSNLTIHTPAWQISVPYMLGGICIILFLVTVALIFLACTSFCNKSAHTHVQEINHAEADQENEMVNTIVSVSQDNNIEEKFFVIMAGDDNPTYVATPSMFQKPSGKALPISGDGSY